jgi:YrbI family 3-deoxy-D-manno-octulosonate 8-phosphate phosphatase
MFQKLRTDLVKKLSGVKLILINAEGFSPGDIHNHGANGLNGFHIRELRNNDVELIAFSRSKSELISSVAERLGIELHQGVSENTHFYHGVKKDYTVSDEEVAFICRDYEDLPVMKSVNFTAVTPEAPLHVKAESYFVTYSEGGGAVNEVAALILKAKKYPGGWSE